MQKIFPFVFVFYLTASPLLAWGDVRWTFSMKNKVIQETTIDQVEKSDLSYQ